MQIKFSISPNRIRANLINIILDLENQLVIAEVEKRSKSRLFKLTFNHKKKQQKNYTNSVAGGKLNLKRSHSDFNITSRLVFAIKMSGAKTFPFTQQRNNNTLHDALFHVLTDR